MGTQKPTDKTYNGWTNYETWVVNQWLTSVDEFEYRAVGALAQNERLTDRQKVDQLKARIEEGNPLSAGLYCDLLGRAIERVNWAEIIMAAKEE